MTYVCQINIFFRNSFITFIIYSSYIPNLLRQLKKNNFVFGGERPLAENTVTRAFNKYISLANVKKIRLHDLRHSHASLLISQNQTIVMVSKRLGHSSTEQTLKTYAHLMPNEENLMVKTLDFKI